MEQSFAPVPSGRGGLVLAAGLLIGVLVLAAPTPIAHVPDSPASSEAVPVSRSAPASSDAAEAEAAESARDWLRAARARARLYAASGQRADRRRLLAACSRGVAVGFGAPSPTAAADRLDELLLPWRDEPRVQEALVTGYRTLARHAMDRNDAAEGRDLTRRLRLLGREDDAREVERLVHAEERWMEGPSTGADDHDHDHEQDRGR